MFRFTIREVLWLTVVVALALGWLIDHRASSQRLKEAANNEAKLSTCGKLLRETIERLEAEGYIWGTSPNGVHLKRNPLAPPKPSN